MKSKDLHTWSWRVWRWELSNLKMQASRLTTSLLSGRGWSEYSCAQNISKNHYFDVWHGAKIFQRSWRLLLRKRTVQISGLGLKDLSTIATELRLLVVKMGTLRCGSGLRLRNMSPTSMNNVPEFISSSVMLIVTMWCEIYLSSPHYIRPMD